MAARNLAKIVSPTRITFFRTLEEAFAHSDVMIEEHRVYAQDALSGEYVMVGQRWMGDCANQQVDACDSNVEKSSSWGIKV